MVGFAFDNGLKVKAQHLVWHRYGESVFLPDWLFDATADTSRYNSQELSFYLKDFITKTITHYNTKFPNCVKWWSVVNEAGSNTTGFIPNLWLDSLGESYVDSAFYWARKAAGEDTKLYYKELSPLTITKRSIQINLNETVDLRIVNLSGETINSVRNYKNKTLPINHLPKGIYIITIHSKNRTWVEKFRKQ